MNFLALVLSVHALASSQEVANQRQVVVASDAPNRTSVAEFYDRTFLGRSSAVMHDLGLIGFHVGRDLVGSVSSILIEGVSYYRYPSAAVPMRLGLSKRQLNGIDQPRLVAQLGENMILQSGHSYVCHVFISLNAEGHASISGRYDFEWGPDVLSSARSHPLDLPLLQESTSELESRLFLDSLHGADLVIDQLACASLRESSALPAR